MALRDIVVHLDTGTRCQARLDFAVELAARHEAHLIGVFPLVMPRFSVASGDEMAHLRIRSEALLETMRETVSTGAETVRRRFEDAANRSGIAAEWRAVEGDDGAVVALHARYADLVVIGQPDPDAESDPLHEVTVTAMLSSGRPVISIPYAGVFHCPTEHALIGWNASREATRAVNDALPLLAACKKVTVLTINPGEDTAAGTGLPADALCAHLARHGITARPDRIVAESISEGTALLNRAADLAVDLIVMGAWGHSRLREWAFGGVTRTLLQSMTAPAFMSS